VRRLIFGESSQKNILVSGNTGHSKKNTLPSGNADFQQYKKNEVSWGNCPQTKKMQVANVNPHLQNQSPSGLFNKLSRVTHSVTLLIPFKKTLLSTSRVDFLYSTG